MAGKEKRYIRLVDIQTGEEVAAAELTAAAVKRLSKLYASFGIYTKEVA
jgi:hypothetical protein